MRKLYSVLDKHAKWIYLGVFVLAVAAIFLPTLAFVDKSIDFKLNISTKYAAFEEYNELIIPFVITLLGTAVVALCLFLNRKIYFLSCISIFLLFPSLFYSFSFRYNKIYVDLNFSIVPHVAFFIYLLIFSFCLFMTAMQLYTKDPIRIPRAPRPAKPPKPKKLSQAERIAELERQVEELKKDKI